MTAAVSAAQELRAELLRETIEWCRASSPFYRARFADLGEITTLDDLAALPVTCGSCPTPACWPRSTVPPGVVQELQAVDGVHDVGLDGTTVRFAVESGSLAAALELLGRHGIRTLSSAPPSLEELFVGLYRSQEQSAAVSS